ncbi:GNAT family N-acetyltransferase [Dactylosporangium sp. AC04546]|uniref:bifunctional acetate--CoA ligase family protein/GNAT family N-acetyltransferase n=1 Tax=Dactylosporangium sp. AC04546 TaxID=2862460 RepID=UPI001EDCA7C5|nr:GNAT family N-acetyltransferase [Dactylosporangium sp. AC04546]WVK78549.1 GNAT family N-acetyltransferase [Dactylosporangium sp. AC04546]
MEATDCLTMDGRIVHVRAIRPDDAPALLALHQRLSPRNRYLRFFTAGAALDAEVRRLTRASDGDRLGLLVEEDGRVLAAGSYERVNPDQADFALVVADEHHGEGLGTLLLEHLAAAARHAGITELVGDVLPENAAMLRVGRGMAPGTTNRFVSGTVRIRVPTIPDEAALAAVGARDRTAAHRSLRPLLAPASVAVIGAGRSAGGVGHEVLAALRDGGYTGALHAVNPHATQVCGVAAHPTVAAIGSPVDLAVIAVPAGSVPDVVRQCCASGVRAAVVLSAGLDRAAERDLVAVARRHGMRIVGPNCLGVINTDPAVRVNAAFAPVQPVAGGLAVASQSGAVGVAILQATTRCGVGVSSFVSLGDKADVSGNDLLTYWYDDPATRAVALYLESFGNPRRFAWVARALATRKPVLAVKSGRAEGGRRAGASPTAAAVRTDTAVQALFAQAGVIRTDTLGELLDTARVLVDQPLPGGSRLAVVGNAGGLNVVAADAARTAALAVPALVAAGANPVDLGAEATPEAMAAAIRAVARAGEADLMVVAFVATRTNDSAAILAAVGAAIDDCPDLPVAVVAVGVRDAPATVGVRRAPVFDLPEPAVLALGRAARYAAWRREPAGKRPVLPGIDAEAARAVIRRALATADGWQPADVARSVLSCYGVPVVETLVATGADETVRFAALAGYPVAVKAAAPGIVHKSDIGAVWLGLSDEAAVRRAYRGIGIALGQARPAVLVQPMAAAGVELVAGVVHDERFGSLVTLGLGGVHTDLLDDRSLRLLPLTDRDATAMWRGLRGAPLLTGYRGAPPVDTAALEDLLLRLGRLAEDLPEIAELDLNPVLAGPGGCTAVDVKLRLARIGVEPETYVRQLTHA